MTSSPSFRRALLGCSFSVCAPIVYAQAAATPAAIPLVTAPVSDASTVALDASLPGAITAATDEGTIASGLSLPHLQVVLKRPASRQAALDALVAEQTKPGSAHFHQWLTPARLMSDYGPAAADIAKTVAWLQSKGLTVNRVSPTGMSIDVAGTADAIGTAFRTALHGYTLAGETHIAPAAAPSIPAALSPIVAGVTLSNFFPKPQLVHAPAQTATAIASAKVSKVGTSYTATFDSTTFYAVTPSDFATIYNENQAFAGAPFFAGPVTGAGETVIVDEQTDINPADWNTFRSTFGLTKYNGTLAITHPGGCTDPGFSPGDETEAAIDAEWSSAVAPDANIVVAACKGTAPLEFGVATALQNLVEFGTNAAAISISYGGCEQGNGLSFEAAFTNLLEEGASEGIPIFVSSGDSAVAGCNENAVATDGLAVNGLATSPYDTAVGGTDFYDTALGQNKKYWTSANSTTGGSALSYVPEIPWDNSCTNIINYENVGEPGPIVNCNLAKPKASYQNSVGGSGGQSLLFAKPDFQLTSLPGVPKDGARDIPDVSLFAANGFWHHFYLECMSNTAKGFGGAPCNYKNASDFLASAYGGTSFGAPDFAGIAALVAQSQGFRSGNMAPRLYQLAQLQFGNPTLVKQCSATNGKAISPVCVFNDVTAGDNTAPCAAGSPNCVTSAKSTLGVGILSTTSTKAGAAFPSTPGYDLATGLGTVNITNLLESYTNYQ